jgi:hypothetical protein
VVSPVNRLITGQGGLLVAPFLQAAQSEAHLIERDQVGRTVVALAVRRFCGEDNRDSRPRNVHIM